MERNIRVLIAKPGLDSHDRGTKILSLALRDAGMEVIYSGLRQTPLQIVEVGIQEDVDVIGLSCLTGGHKHFFTKVIELLQQKQADDIVVLGGGIIPEEDVNYLKERGVEEIFPPGTAMIDIVSFIKKRIKEKMSEGNG